MKKRPFVLIEVLIAMALLALCAFPLISEPIFSYKKMRDHLFELELEREIENIYYEIRKKTLKFESINRSKISLAPIEISVAGLGKKIYTHPHYHLYHSAPKGHISPYYKVWVGICLNECKSNHNAFNYKFAFLGKKVDQNPVNSHGDNKTEKIDERSPSVVQTIRKGE